jgi:murein L,D-transpeptidase YafK
MKYFYVFVLGILFFLNVSCENINNKAKNNEKKVHPIKIRKAFPDEPISNIFKKENITNQKKWLLIDKKKLELSVIVDEKIMKTYPIVLGFNQKDDKRYEGDGCTPEGSFNIISKYNHKKWSRFIWINYPNESSWKKHKNAKKAKTINEEATIGGEVGIHGVPNNNDSLIDEYRHWTLGCISLKTDHIIEIYEIVNKNTRIEIK